MTECAQSEQVELEKASDSGQPDWTDPMYQTNEFKMYCWKIAPCTNSKEHDQAECPFAHPGENSVRRDPRIYKYRPDACPATQSKNGKCSVGVHCHLAHNVFERWLHPMRFRTQMCRDGADCSRKHTCFFAHTDEELRIVPDLGLTSNSSSSAVPPPSASPSLSAKHTSSMNSSFSSAFALPGSPAALSRSSSSSSRASSTAAMSPLSCVSRQSSFTQSAQSLPLYAQHQLNTMAGMGGGLPRGKIGGYAAQAGHNKQWGLQPGLSGPMASYQAGLSGPFAGPQAALHDQVLAAQLQQQLELQQRKQLLEQLQLQMLLQQQQQTAFLQPDFAALLEQQVLANIQQAAQACAAAKAAEDQLAMLRAAAPVNSGAARLPAAMRQHVFASAPADAFSLSPDTQSANSSMTYNNGSSASFMPNQAMNPAVSVPLASSPVSNTPSALQQGDMLLALLLAQEQQQAQPRAHATHMPSAPAGALQCGFQPVSNSNTAQASQLAALVAATAAAARVPAAAVGQLGAPTAGLYVGVL